MLQSIDVQEFELDRIVSGCMLYMNPDQHKNLRVSYTMSALLTFVYFEIFFIITSHAMK